MSNDNPCKRILVLYTSVAEALTDVPEQLRDDMDMAVHARDVTEVFREAGHQAECVCWDDALQPTIEALRVLQPQVVFNLTECPLGVCRKAPYAAGLLELLRLPYTGNGPLAQALATDKVLAKRILAAHGIPTPAYELHHDLSRECELTFPVIVKPAYEDGSLGITEASVVDDAAQLRRQVDHVLTTFRQAALIEAFMPGREFQVTILGNGTAEDPYHIPPPAEIAYTSTEWRIVSYAAKWEPQHPAYKATPPVCPAELTKELRERLVGLGTACAEAFGLTGYARVDIRLDAHGKPHVLEVNPNPDLSRDAGLPRAARAAGLDYAALLLEIVRLGLALGAR